MPAGHKEGFDVAQQPKGLGDKRNRKNDDEDPQGWPPNDFNGDGQARVDRPENQDGKSGRAVLGIQFGQGQSTGRALPMGF